MAIIWDDAAVDDLAKLRDLVSKAAGLNRCLPFVARLQEVIALADELDRATYRTVLKGQPPGLLARLQADAVNARGEQP